MNGGDARAGAGTNAEDPSLAPEVGARNDARGGADQRDGSRRARHAASTASTGGDASVVSPPGCAPASRRSVATPA